MRSRAINGAVRAQASAMSMFGLLDAVSSDGRRRSKLRAATAARRVAGDLSSPTPSSGASSPSRPALMHGLGFDSGMPPMPAVLGAVDPERARGERRARSGRSDPVESTASALRDFRDFVARHRAAMPGEIADSDTPRGARSAHRARHGRQRECRWARAVGRIQVGSRPTTRNTAGNGPAHRAVAWCGAEAARARGLGA